MFTPPLERRLDWRRQALLAGWLVAAAVLVARAVQLQVLDAAEWRTRAAAQHRTTSAIPAPRGAILDRHGVPLAISRERWKVSVDPQLVADADEVRALLQEVLGISASTARRVTDPDREWAEVPGVFEPSVREKLAGVEGIFLARRLHRDYPHGELALGVLGRVLDERGTGGIEAAYDSLLRGRSGREVVARDGSGREIPGEVFEMEPPVPGGDVVLTLDLDLQEVAEQALREAVAATSARGGDVVVSDPRSGDILALASIVEGDARGLSAINAPYEPGSTLKPFTVTAILKNGRGRLGDSVDVGQGSWSVNGRVLNDVHSSGRMTLADALRVSSNIGVAKAALGLTPAELYENLRDFGFGMSTGFPLPGESGGQLLHPRHWTRPSPQSLAIGYEVSATPLQMAMAYGALANGGRLMEARIIREVRPGPGQRDVRSPRVLRQVADPTVVDEIGEVLTDVVEDGTGTAAQLESFLVAGKSGTSRYHDGTRYVLGQYLSSFAGYFPADDPQLVIFVKLDRPQGSYYGGATAAPVTRATMESVLAARRSPLDRGALLKVVRKPPQVRPASTSDGRPLTTPVRFASLEERWEAAEGVDAAAPTRPEQALDLPDVRGLPPRVAVRRLHALGLRVVWADEGAILGTAPRAGSRVVPGDTIHLRTGRPPR